MGSLGIAALIAAGIDLAIEVVRAIAKRKRRRDPFPDEPIKTTDSK
jgi:hypothetical protein